MGREIVTGGVDWLLSDDIDFRWVVNGWFTVGFVLWFDEWGFGGLLMIGSRWVRDSGARWVQCSVLFLLENMTGLMWFGFY